MRKYGNDTDGPLVSVIIPFYNLGKYAKLCMESMILQDCQDCEFICVDDGSTDDTPDILNAYSNDDRVKIVRKENGGLSDARNFGLSIAKGEYVTFIDGDDFVHPNYLSNLLKASKEQDGAPVICPLKIIRYDEQLDIKAGWSDAITCHLLSKRDVFEKVLYDELSVSACGKLIHREAYDDIMFPLGKVSEEVATIGKLLRKYESFSIVSQPLYGYVMRPGSIGRKKTYKIKDINDRIESMQLLEETIKGEFELDKDSALAKALQYRWAWRYVDMANMFENVEDDRDMALEIKKRIRKWLKKNIMGIISNARASVSKRLAICLYTFSPNVYIALLKVYKRKKYGL